MPNDMTTKASKRIDSDEPPGTFTMVNAFITILSRYAYHIHKDDYQAALLYEDVLGASICHYVAINSPAVDVSIITSHEDGIFSAVLSFDLIGPRNNQIGKTNVAKHIVDYLALARAHMATAEYAAPAHFGFGTGS